MDETQLRERIRRLHETGEVPCDNPPDKVWAGRGTGDLCVLCIEPIASTETEFEVELSPTKTIFRLHRQCYYRWLEECGAIVAQG